MCRYVLITQSGNLLCNKNITTHTFVLNTSGWQTLNLSYITHYVKAVF